MDNGGWLSTKNRKKVSKPQPKLQKRRSSALKPLKSTYLQRSNSPPPKQLFTATKQSSLNQFFSRNDEPQLEVEVNFDEDSPSGNSEHTPQINDDVLTSLKSETHSEHGSSAPIRQDSKGSTGLPWSKDSIGYGGKFGNGNENSHRPCGTVALKTETNMRESAINKETPEISEIKQTIVEVSEENKEKREEKGDCLSDCHKTNLQTEYETGTDRLAIKGLLNRKRNSSDTFYRLGPSVKRKRNSDVLSENIECIEHVDLVDQKKTVTGQVKERKECLIEDLGSAIECTGNSQDVSHVSVPMSCFSSQSLQLDSKDSFIYSQQSELEMTNTLVLGTQDESFRKRINNTDLENVRDLQDDTETLEQDILSNSLTFSSPVGDVDSECNDGLFSVNSQSDTIGATYKRFMSPATLDLSTQNDSFAIGTEAIEHIYTPNELQEDSHLSFASSPPELFLEDQSLQLT